MEVTEYTCADCCGPAGCNCSPPTTLYADITTDACGSSFATASSVELTYGSDDCWGATSITPNMPSAILSVNMCCVDGQWTMTILFIPAACTDTYIETATSEACDPFEAVFTFTIGSACCTPSGGTLTVTVME